jgi:hypothetical protein
MRKLHTCELRAVGLTRTRDVAILAWCVLPLSLWLPLSACPTGFEFASLSQTYPNSNVTSWWVSLYRVSRLKCSTNSRYWFITCLQYFSCFITTLNDKTSQFIIIACYIIMLHLLVMQFELSDDAFILIYCLFNCRNYNCSKLNIFSSAFHSKLSLMVTKKRQRTEDIHVSTSSLLMLIEISFS